MSCLIHMNQGLFSFERWCICLVQLFCIPIQRLWIAYSMALVIALFVLTQNFLLPSLILLLQSLEEINSGLLLLQRNKIEEEISLHYWVLKSWSVSSILSLRWSRLTFVYVPPAILCSVCTHCPNEIRRSNLLFVLISYFLIGNFCLNIFNYFLFSWRLSFPFWRPKKWTTKLCHC